MLHGKALRPERSAREVRRKRENHRPVSVPDVPFGSLKVGRRRRFLQLVILWDRTPLRFPAVRALSAVGQIGFQLPRPDPQCPRPSGHQRDAFDHARVTATEAGESLTPLRRHVCAQNLFQSS